MTEENNTSNNFGSMLATLLSFVAIGLVVALGYFGYLRYQSISSKIVELEQSKGVYQNQIRGLQQALDTQNTQVLSLVDQRDAAVQELSLIHI